MRRRTKIAGAVALAVELDLTLFFSSTGERRVAQLSRQASCSAAPRSLTRHFRSLASRPRDA